MKRPVLLLFIVFNCIVLPAQEVPAETEQGLENVTMQDETATEDDSYLQQLDRFRKHPLNLNAAETDELKQLQLLNDLQIGNLVVYRNLLGKLISVYELQAVPSWDIYTIKRLLPFITVTNTVDPLQESMTRFKKAEQLFLLRYAQALGKIKDTAFKGSPQRVLFRYKYSYKDLLQFGVTGDKDAGEQFFKGAQKAGFDYYSIHLFARRLGKIKALAVGDYTVNMGQGLIQWQGLAFKKSAEATGIKRQSPVLSPYSSAGEFYFYRGAGITLSNKKTEATAFVSYRRLNANKITDTVSGDEYITSFLTAGYNRTQNEISDRANTAQFAAGGNLVYQLGKLKLGCNAVFYKYSSPIRKRDEPYNLYAISGSKWSDYSIDYSYTFRNIHFFGEAAADKNFSRAFLNGMLLSMDPRVDMAFLYRSISKAYQAVNGNAFTENTYPANENGFYAGITIRPAPGWKADAYADIFSFPWLRYRADGPSAGRDYLLQLSYSPVKQAELYIRYRNELKQENAADDNTGIHQPGFLSKQSWRVHLNYKLSTAVTIRSRAETNRYGVESTDRQNGFLLFLDCIYKPMLSRIAGAARLQYVETDGYESRIYAYENDVQYSYSIPANAGRGYRYYLLVSADINKNISCWVRWSGTFNRSVPTSRSLSGGTEAQSAELKLQIRLIL